jgi:type I restriction-modification system DNA methylase subunit
MNPPYSLSKQKTKNSKKEIEFVDNLLNLVNGYAAIIVPLHTFNSRKIKTKAKKANKKEGTPEIKKVSFKESIYHQNTLKAVINMPRELFHPINFETSIVIFQTGKPHEREDQVYFYNLEDDDFAIFDGIRQIHPEKD